ncbi:Phosphoglycerol transferase, alkaline phosphatase superfamily [Methanoculleus chikugoensis]|uniref:Phosphoglycerol transferase, alkaline phosphatase superfamily n=1 Tax=Methanoculleus chikugoensis TaxID=118126 RepID=A0A1M4MIL0_9EURY|nr:sulfatase-like hydrolase/transferase [Methanoculleus chikugoensis]SCL74658.1 Phosphoglycerol transferase, alkaline phosphatase superfamily [Methanoculleus chikugoensis]
MTIRERIQQIFHDPEKWGPTVAASFLLSLTLLFFGPSYLYYTNILEIPYLYTDLVWVFVIHSLVAGVILSILSLFLKGSVHQRVVVLVFALGLLFWVQGHILVWDYGILNGREIVWNDYLLNGIIDSAVWIAILGVALFKAPSFYKHIALASVLLLVVQGGGLAAEIYQAPDEPEWKSYTIGYDDETMFEFSKEQNVIILVLDSFQSDVFQEIIDEEDEYREMLDGFTYYRNAMGGFPTTYASVTFILTGEYYDNSIPIQDFIKNAFLEDSIPLILKENGYRVDLFPLEGAELYLGDEIASNVGTQQHSRVDKDVDQQKGAMELYRLTMFRYVPHFLKSEFYFMPFVELGDSDDLHRDVVFYNSLISSTVASSEARTFKYYHIWGAHGPYTLNAQLQQEDLPQDRSGAKEQSKAALNIAGELITQLKRQGIYDNSIIFIISDHGTHAGRIGLNTGSLDESAGNEIQTVGEGVIASGLPLMLVKPFNSDGDMAISDAPVTLGDVPHTIASVLMLSDVPSGPSIFSFSDSSDRDRKFYHYNWSQWLDGEYHTYLPPMSEYSVSGHSWLPSSWKPTFRIYKPKEVVISLPTYEYDSVTQFGIKGTAQQYQLAGWSGPEEGFTWTSGPLAVLAVRTKNTDSDLTLTITASPYLGGEVIDQQRMIVAVNRQYVGEWVFEQSGFQEKTIVIPREVLEEEIQYVAFELPDAVSPSDLGLSEDKRSLAIAVHSMRICS